MNKKEILSMAEILSNEKDLPLEVIFEAIEAALAVVTKKRHEKNIDVRVSINRSTGDYKTFRCFTVVDDALPEKKDEEESEVIVEEEDNQILWFDPEVHVRLSDAQNKNQSIELGHKIEEPMESIEFGRIDAQMAKRVILHEINKAVWAHIVNVYSTRKGTLLTGIVKRVVPNLVVMDLGDSVEGLILREDMIPREAVRVGDRLRGYLYDVRFDPKGAAQLFISRTHPSMLIELFKIEVPEIGEGVIQIKGAARDPGSRAKIAVKTNDGRIDPVGACVGMRGARVQAVSSELAGERIDIVLWDDNPVQLVINAMAPAEVASIVLDEDSHSMDIAVLEENLSQAIGRNGQNVRLASQLTGWNLNVMSTTDAEEKTNLEMETLQKLFVEQLDVDEEVAQILIEQGFSSIEEIAYVPAKELLALPGFDEELAEELKNRAKDALLARALKGEEELSSAGFDADLLALEGMDRDLAFALASHGIKTREDLAEQAVDDLMEIQNMDKQTAAKIIMAARAHWFE
jgi:transcription termination/antitermination protein NusA